MLYQAVCALAGFYVGEQYNVPWATTAVPAELQMQIFPFAEGVLADLIQVPDVNFGTINFLELLQLLRNYFWRVSLEASFQRLFFFLSARLCTGNCRNPSVIPRLCPPEAAAGTAVR